MEFPLTNRNQTKLCNDASSTITASCGVDFLSFLLWSCESVEYESVEYKDWSQQGVENRLWILSNIINVCLVAIGQWNFR